MEPKELVRVHPSLKNNLRMVVLPILVTPGLIILLKATLWETMSFFPEMLIFILVGLLFPAIAWVETRTYTYTVHQNSVKGRRGLLSKNTSEIRIADIRAINVRQNLWQRILRLGDVGFSSSAGDEEEVVFKGVAHPNEIKLRVRARMNEIHDEADAPGSSANNGDDD